MIVSKNRIQRVVLLTAVLISAQVFFAPAQAQDASKAAVVVAVNNLNELFNDLTAVSQWAGAADQAGFPLMMARAGVSKVNQNKPIGALLSFENGNIKPLIFVPVDDLKALFSQLKEQIGVPKDLGGDLYELRANGETVFVRKHTDWAFLSNDQKSVSGDLANPVPAIAELTKQYDIAIQVNVRNIPNDMMRVAMTQLKAAMENAGRQNGGDAELQKQMRDNMNKQLDILAEEVETITVGLTIDANAKTIATEFGITASKGTELAKRMSASADVKSVFASLINQAAAASLQVASSLAPEDIDQAVDSLKTARQRAMKHIESEARISDQATRDTAKGALNSIMDTLEATVRGGNLDFAAQLMLNDQKLQILAGGLLADGTKLEAGIKKLVDIAKNAPEAPEFRLNVDSHQGLNFHTVSISTEHADEEVQDMLGDSVEVTLGIGKDKMYVAIGTDGIAAIKQGMLAGASTQPVSGQPMRMQLALAPILKFAATVSDDSNLERIAAALAQSDGKDHIRLTTRPVPRGSVGRFEIENGVLRAIGATMGARTGR